ARQTFSSVPSLAHWRNRLCTVLFLPYRSGNSSQGAPVRKIQRMPSKHFRALKRGRPPLRSLRRQGFFRALGKCARILSHCLSVNRFLNIFAPNVFDYVSTKRVYKITDETFWDSF